MGLHSRTRIDNTRTRDRRFVSPPRQPCSPRKRSRKRRPFRRQARGTGALLFLAENRRGRLEFCGRRTIQRAADCRQWQRHHRFVAGHCICSAADGTVLWSTTLENPIRALDERNQEWPSSALSAGDGVLESPQATPSSHSHLASGADLRSARWRPSLRLDRALGAPALRESRKARSSRACARRYRVPLTAARRRKRFTAFSCAM